MAQDNDRAAFGHFPQMRPRRSRQDREAAKDVPVALGRGALAGVLGMPGDLESLVRMLPGLPEETVLPTSEDIERRLPLRSASASPVGRAATGLGTLAGGFYTGPGSPARLVASVPGALRHGASEFAKAAGQPAANIIKPPGGQWLAGSVKRGVQGLKKFDLPDLMPERGAPPPNTPENEAVNRWIDSNLANYLQKQMGTVDDPVRKLAEEGVTHIPNLGEGNIYPGSALRHEREMLGFPQLGVAESPMAKRWENLADEAIATHKAGNIQKTMGMEAEAAKAKELHDAKLAEVMAKFDEHARSKGTLNEQQIEAFKRTMAPEAIANIVDDAEYAPLMYDYRSKHIQATGPNKAIGDANPWIAKLDPNETIYSGGVYGMGFDHVVDVLREAVATGRIRPEQLNKVSMEQAVRMTHQYDIDAAAKMNAARAAAREGLPVHKEYPEGYRWVELNRPGAFATESEAMGHSVRGYEPPQGHPDWIEGSGEAGSPYYGHGGWEGIKSGRAKIYSLVDPKGEPHVTVEVRRGKQLGEKDLPNDVRDELAEAYGDASREEFEAAVRKYFEGRNIPDEITQIKGKQNRAPNEQYLPYVQDFLRSGQWGRIGDIDNTGLVDLNRYDSRLQQAGQEAYGSRFLTNEQMDELLSAQQKAEGYAEGGEVRTPGLFSVSPYSKAVSTEMYPGQVGVDDQRDAARHMLAAGTMARKYGPAIARFAGKAHEYTSAPIDWAAYALGLGKRPEDFEMDAHNNDVGIELGRQARDQRHLEDMVQEAAERAARQYTPGRAVIRKAVGGAVSDVEATRPDFADGGAMLNDPTAPQVQRDMAWMATQPGYAGGGQVKTAVKGAKEGVDLLRRKLFGLPEHLTSTEISVAPGAVQKVETTTTPSRMEQLLQKVEEHPLSRRDVLSRTAKTVGSQAVRGAVPAELAKMATKEVAREVLPAAVASDIPGILAAAVRAGKPLDEALAEIRRTVPPTPAARAIDPAAMYDTIADPYALSEMYAEKVRSGMTEAPSAGRVMQDMLQMPPESSIYQMRAPLRGLRRANPEAYSEMRSMAKDLVDYGFDD